MKTITRKSLFIDKNQGLDAESRNFGFVGTNSTEKYQGWFFTWPRGVTSRSIEAEAEEILGTLDPDTTCSHLPQIPRRFAEQRLLKFLLQAKY